MNGRRPADPIRDAGDDPVLEQRLQAWLAEAPDQPPDTLADASIAQARKVDQRPALVARFRGARGARGAEPVRLGLTGAALAGAVVVAIVAWAGLTRPTGPGGSPSSSPGPAGSPAASGAGPFDGRAVDALALASRASALGEGFGALWLGDASGRVHRIDPAGPTIVASIDVGGVPCGPILAAASWVWLTTCGDGSTTESAATVRVDPSTNTVADRYAAGGGDGVGGSALNGLVWFISDVEAGRLTAVDAQTGQLVRDLDLDAPVRHLAAGFGSLWVSPIGRPAVLRIDPGTGNELAAVSLSGDAGYLLTTADAIWVAEAHQWLVGRIDPVADRVAAEIGATPGVGHLVSTGNGIIWALANDTALAIDPASNLEIDRFSVPAHLAFDGVNMHLLAVAGGHVWYADGLTLLRID